MSEIKPKPCPFCGSTNVESCPLGERPDGKRISCITPPATTAGVTARSSRLAAVSFLALTRPVPHRSTCGTGGQMITDKERHATAEELHARHGCGGFDQCDECQDLSLRLFGDTQVPCQLGSCDTDYWEKLADLIDRPTCRLEPTAVETHGNTEVRIYECSECGRSCEEIYGKYERRPHCGAEVIRDGH